MPRQYISVYVEDKDVPVVKAALEKLQEDLAKTAPFDLDEFEKIDTDDEDPANA